MIGSGEGSKDQWKVFPLHFDKEMSGPGQTNRR